MKDKRRHNIAKSRQTISLVTKNSFDEYEYSITMHSDKARRNNNDDDHSSKDDDGSMHSNVIVEGPLKGCDDSNRNSPSLLRKGSERIRRISMKLSSNSSCSSVSSNASMSSFMSNLLNHSVKSSSEGGGAVGPNQEFHIMIVQDNAKTAAKSFDQQAKLVTLQRSQSKQRNINRWGGTVDSTAMNTTTRNTLTTPTTSLSTRSNKPSLSSTRRESSDSCLSDLIPSRRRSGFEGEQQQPQETQLQRQSKHSSSQQNLIFKGDTSNGLMSPRRSFSHNQHETSTNSNRVRTRPSMKSCASDSTLLKMPTRSASPRIRIRGREIRSGSKNKNKNASWDHSSTSSSSSLSSSTASAGSGSPNLANAMFTARSISSERLSSSSKSSRAAPITSSLLMGVSGGDMSTPSLGSIGRSSDINRAASNDRRSILQDPSLMGLEPIRRGQNGSYQSSKSAASRSQQLQQTFLQQLNVRDSHTSPNSGSHDFKASISKASILNNPQVLERFNVMQEKQQQGTASLGSTVGIIESASRAALGSANKMKDPTALGLALKIKNPLECGLKVPTRQRSIEG